MLATGGSLLHTLKRLEAKNASKVSILNIVAAPQGCAIIEKYYPNVDLYTLAIDKTLADPT